MNTKKKKMIRTQIFITRRQKDLIKEETENIGLSMGEIIRRCIDKYLKRNYKNV